MEKVWQKVLSELEKEFPKQIYEPLIKPLVLRKDENDSNDIITLQVKDETLIPFLNTSCMGSIRSKLRSIMGRNVTVEFQLENSDHHQYITRSLTSIQTMPWLNSNLTFDQFIKGSSNKLAFLAAESAAENYKNANPLFLYGNPGLGKTHLVHSIVNSVIEKNPSATFKYILIDEFKIQLLQAIKNRKTSSFKKQNKSFNALIIEDIQYLKNSAESTQEELFYLYNHYYESGKQIIITSDVAASKLSVSDRLLSRLMSGLLVNIDKPDKSMRNEYLLKRNSVLNLELPTSYINLISSFDFKNFIELESVLTRIYFIKNKTHKLPELDNIKNILNDSGQSEETHYSIDLIVQAVCSAFSVTPEDMFNSSRKVEITLPRHVAMYLAVNYSTLNKSSIARYFHRNDHTTVINAEKNIMRKIKNSEAFSQLIANIVDNLRKT